MHRLHAVKGFLAAAALALGVGAATAHAADITGAGATFPYPIYAKWAEAYKKATGVGMNYQSIGSGGGIAQIKAKTVDFGASDVPLKAEDLDAVGPGPVPDGHRRRRADREPRGIAPGPAALHRPGARRHLPRQDQELERPGDRRAQPGRQAARASRSPSSIARTARARPSSSPTTCPRSARNGRPRSAPARPSTWPAGVGGKGNEGVAAYVQRIKGSIGYVEYAYAKKNKMALRAVQNRDGQFVQPDDATFQAAAAGADWKGTPGFDVILTDQPGKAAGRSPALVHPDAPSRTSRPTPSRC